MYTAPAGRPDPRRRETLWTRVEKNRIRLAGYVALFVVSAIVSAESMLIVFGGCGAFYAARATHGASIELFITGFSGFLSWTSVGVGVTALAWALVAINRSERWLVDRLGSTLVPKGELVPVKMALKDMAIAAGLPVAPALYLLDDRSLNAFVFSARGRRPIVGITPGFLERLTLDEQRAVFANLVARIVSGDTIVDTGVAAIMLPLHVYRSRRIEHENRAMDAEMLSRGGTARIATASGRGYEGVAFLFVLGVAMAIMGAVFVAFQRHRQLRAAEKADAEGMLLLKDPRPMLSALEKCVVFDNRIERAGEEFADLFYCWPGVSTNDDDDPEWRRVARLREVLGVEGMVDERADEVPDGLFAPPAPRLEQL